MFDQIILASCKRMKSATQQKQHDAGSQEVLGKLKVLEKNQKEKVSETFSVYKKDLDVLESFVVYKNVPERFWLYTFNNYKLD